MTDQWRSVAVLVDCGFRKNSILDWFHITKKFQPILNMNILGEEDKKRLEQVKWELWHGKHEKVLFNLTDVIKDMADEEMVSKLKSLFIYLNANKNQLCHYSERESQGLLFTSHVAESTVEHLIIAGS